MILRDDVRYIVFDVETTGLDRKHDEIIQIWIVEYTAQGDIVQQFSSYIKPTTTEKLHDIVGMITGISIEELETAPSWWDIADQVEAFFGPTSVVIWHSVDFDIAMIQRYGRYDMYTYIDTFPLSQSLYPYLPSYALEILWKNILSTPPTVQFHDALGDSILTGAIFFQLTKKLESILYGFPYLWEICKRTNVWLPLCLSYKNDTIHLLKEIPLLSAPVQQVRKIVDTKSFPIWQRYIGNSYFETILKNIQIDYQCLAFSHHPKVLLAQKRLAKLWVMTPLHEQIAFDSQTLHHFFTKQSYLLRERYCAIKYILHAQENHSSYQIINNNDTLFTHAMRLQIHRDIRKKIYTHTDLFEAVDQGNIPPEQHIIMRDKERLFDNWKRRKYKWYDLYELATLLDAFVYKYELLWVKTDILAHMRDTYYIFLWIFWWEAAKLCLDAQTENVSLLSINESTYFYKSMSMRRHIESYLTASHTFYDTQDIVLLEKHYNHIATLLDNPVIIQRKRAQRQEWFMLQPEDSYTTRDDIHTFFDRYNVSYFSALDTKIPPLTTLPWDLLQRTSIQKRKDITVWSNPKLCIIAPSKQAAQQLIVSLHKSSAYKDCFLAAEHITWWAWKIIQQTLWKTAYVLIWSYNFCMQCIAHSLEFDSIGALDIINSNSTINPFTDIEYYASHTHTKA